MTKHKIAYAGSAVALMLGSGILSPLGAFAEGEKPFCIEGGECYETLQAAFDAVPNDGTLTTVYLDSTDNIVEDGGGAFYEYGKGAHPANNNYNVVFDLKGKTFVVNREAVGSTGYETQALHLEKGGKFVMKDGIMKTTATSGVKMILQNYADTTLDNVTLDASDTSGVTYTASNNFGSLTVKGDSNILASEGNVAFDIWYGMASVYYGGISVTFGEDFTGKVNGKIEYGCSSSGGGCSETNWQEKAKLSIANGTFETSFAEGSTGALDGANIVISGGTFKEEPKAEYIAKGYKDFAIDNEYIVLPLITEITLGYGDEEVELYTRENQILTISYVPEGTPVDFEVSTNNPELFMEDSLKIVESNGVYAVSFIARDEGDGEGVVTVTEKNSGVSASVKVKVVEALRSADAVAEDGTTAFVGFKDPVEGENLGMKIVNEEMTTEEKTKISPYLKAVYDLNVVNQTTGEVVPVSDNEIEVTLIFKKADYEGMKYFKAGFINDEGKLVETFDAEANYHEDEGEESEYFALTFTTTHFSTYGILASATEFPEVLTPDTGVLTANDASTMLDYGGLVATVAAMTVMTVAMEIALWKRNQARK